MVWRKVLYEDQGVPDNYTDRSFLEDKKKNVNARIYKMKDVMLESGIVSQQVALICIFLAFFVYLESGSLGPSWLFIFDITCLCIGSAIRCALVDTKVEWLKVVKISLLIFMVSPILKTLTKTISTDTIYAMATCMFLVNLMFHDYGADAAIVSKAISINASIFGAVCLASRLPTFWHVYVYIMTAIGMFVSFSQFRQDIKCWHRKVYIMLTESLVVIATLMLIPLHFTAAVALVTSHFAITIFFPAWMIRLQKAKNNIHGPWDEAMIRR